MFPLSQPDAYLPDLPRFVRVEITVDPQHGEFVPLLHHWFYDLNATVSHLIDYDESVNARNQPLQVIRSTQFPLLTATPNRVLMNLGSQHQWSGTIVVLKYADSLCRRYADINLSDLDDIKAHFRAFA